MSKLQLSHPTLFLLFGFPGAGKTFFARQICEELQAAHIQGDRIRFELFDNPRYDRQENEVVAHIMEYMAEEFLQAGISVVFDINAMRGSRRRELRDMARRHKAKTVLIWFQLDIESSFTRVAKRDRRKADDKYSMPLDRTTFDAVIAGMQNPALTEDYMVISGKRTFATQRSAVIKKLYDMGLLQSEQTQVGIAKPALVNLIPNSNGGRVDPSRRNITIR
ncbi:MAG TPA: ATP-binding protein [Candidatus Saccharimonadales bacterium]|nr:ATP-binding protein [Candidatus Saccharimonadales bacterium]